MASLDPTTKSTYATTNWAHYRQGRPPYPPSLTELIYTYHRQHPTAQWDRLVDVGAGSGVAATNFLPAFNTVHISDPSPANLDQARAFLPAWASSRGLSPTLEYSAASGEDAHLHAGPSAADLVICATAAHFIDPDGLAASIATMLRPGGTMAVFSYWMPTFPGRSQRFHDVFARVWDALVLGALAAREQEACAGDDLRQTRLARVVARRVAGNGVLDSLPVPPEFFTDARRVYINAPADGGIPYAALFEKFVPAERGISRVSESEEIVHYETGRDAEAEGWLFEVDREWLPGFVDTVRPVALGEEERREAYAEWEEVFGEECPGGVLQVLWPAYLVLATRK
ncbi:hypothetical protein BU26DRAFT_536400 [Trematosphaeria pertusa]|uniref:Methyltransferase type 11 domain-containing protein n=1 Tax=Trematosphaeria pertusa TaxID=390896 RepID=A0A6A6J0F7_9PLEO|nr:uncharacterized protein BU26DRAFT_536400 [Trematosphaeria pertusa]KAF2256106.1 hypothetical protein BU26DRAFT_536400 [Trematosphaeria pertusa]